MTILPLTCRSKMLGLAAMGTTDVLFASEFARLDMASGCCETTQLSRWLRAELGRSRVRERLALRDLGEDGLTGGFRCSSNEFDPPGTAVIAVPGSGVLAGVNLPPLRLRDRADPKACQGNGSGCRPMGVPGNQPLAETGVRIPLDGGRQLQEAEIGDMSSNGVVGEKAEAESALMLT